MPSMVPGICSNLFPLLRTRRWSEQVAAALFLHPLTYLLPRQLAERLALLGALRCGREEVLYCVLQEFNLLIISRVR